MRLPPHHNSLLSSWLKMILPYFHYHPCTAFRSNHIRAHCKLTPSPQYTLSVCVVVYPSSPSLFADAGDFSVWDLNRHHNCLLISPITWMILSYNRFLLILNLLGLKHFFKIVIEVSPQVYSTVCKSQVYYSTPLHCELSSWLSAAAAGDFWVLRAGWGAAQLSRVVSSEERGARCLLL